MWKILKGIFSSRDQGTHQHSLPFCPQALLYYIVSQQCLSFREKKNCKYELESMCFSVSLVTFLRSTWWSQLKREKKPSLFLSVEISPFLTNNSVFSSCKETAIWKMEKKSQSLAVNLLFKFSKYFQHTVDLQTLISTPLPTWKIALLLPFLLDKADYKQNSEALGTDHLVISLSTSDDFFLQRQSCNLCYFIGF